ncbi:MAG: type II toxin-antitoxin system VapC family toxin [Deltaproteobacteria bacterium]|nr:type II toxin-antitoxin system VapC family toxin [Deltaproteobacteria bacterium]
MRIALDTNRYVDFCRGDPRTVEVLRTAEAILLPFVAMAELRAGFRIGSRGAENEKTLARFLNGPRVRVLYADEQTTHHYARLFFQLSTQGAPIPTNDLWIAALVAQHDLILFDRDRHFDHLPQLARC